jgi:predicted O-methyltransferase YrrM
VDIVDVNAADAAWSMCGLPKSPVEFLAELDAETMTTFINRPALDMLGGEEKYDFIFLDGDHSARAVYCEIAAALKALQPSGLILLHDFYPGRKPLTPDGSVILGPAMAAERVNKETDELRFLPLGNLPWKTKSGGNATSLALVARG